MEDKYEIRRRGYEGYVSELWDLHARAAELLRRQAKRVADTVAGGGAPQELEEQVDSYRWARDAEFLSFAMWYLERHRRFPPWWKR